jgi:hypothetical protein
LIALEFYTPNAFEFSKKRLKIAECKKCPIYIGGGFSSIFTEFFEKWQLPVCHFSKEFRANRGRW